MDNIATLIRLAKLELDDKRKVLAALLTRDDQLVAARAALAEALAHEVAHAKTHAEEQITLGAFIEATHKKEKAIDTQRRLLAKEIAAAQDALQVCFETLKRYEIAQDQRDKAARRDNLRRETIKLDEVAARKKGETS